MCVSVRATSSGAMPGELDLVRHRINWPPNNSTNAFSRMLIAATSLF